MKHNYDFLKHNKAIERDTVAELLLEWQQNLLNGDDLLVRLTDFVVHRYAPTEKDRKHQSYVVRVTGYQTMILTSVGSYVICCYSPLAKGFLGKATAIDYAPNYTQRLVEIAHSPIHNVKLSPLDPLTDDQTKRLLMAADNDYQFCDLCIRDRSQIERWNYLNLYEEPDPILAMVKYIRTVLPEPKRKTLMDVYDTYGPIDTVVGDALLHLDKFRSF